MSLYNLQKKGLSLQRTFPLENLLLDAGMSVAAAIPSLTAFGAAVSLGWVEMLASMTAEVLSTAPKVKREPAGKKIKKQPSN